MTTVQADAFLREWAPLLRAQGFGVRLPDWAVQEDQQLGLRLHVRPVETDQAAAEQAGASASTLGLSALLDFDWRVAVGDQEISLEELERVAAENAPLVRLRDRWITFNREAAAEAIAFIRQPRNQQLTLLDALRWSYGAEETKTGLPLVGLRGTGWVDRFLRGSTDATIETVPQPDAFVGELRPYQQRGLSWLAFCDRLGLGACLADDMGLGKTIQLIALLLHERSQGDAVGPTLLFAPMSVVGNWDREIRRFGPTLRVMVHRGTNRLAGDAFRKHVAEHDVVLTTYGLACRDIDDLRRVHWRRVALDEAQKIKNPSANQTIAIRAIPSDHRVALTGTPLENHLSELWSILDMLNPGLLGSAGAFRKRFAVPIEKSGDRARGELLRGMIRPFVLRRLKSDPDIECDLPEKMEMRVYCSLTREQAALYSTTVDEMLGRVDEASGIQRRGLILATLTKLKQICNHPAHFLADGSKLDGRSGKGERIVEMVDELIEEGDAALVFTQFRVMGHLLETLLVERLGAGVQFLHGGTPATKRDEMTERFQNPAGGISIFIISLRAGGFGLNLSRANHVFHFDRWWNPAVEQQATDRAHRIGQTRVVQVHKFVCLGTIEDRIDKLLEEKAALAKNIIGSGDEWLTNLSAQKLREYLTLSSDAVMDD